MTKTFTKFQKELFQKMDNDPNAYDDFVKNNRVTSGDRYFHKKTCREHVITFIPQGSFWTIFNLETGKTTLFTDDYVKLIFRLKRDFEPMGHW